MSDKAYLAALHRVDELKRQRDLLRETLEKIATTAHGYHDADAAYMAGLARAALAETEEKTQ